MKNVLHSYFGLDEAQHDHQAGTLGWIHDIYFNGLYSFVNQRSLVLLVWMRERSL